MTHDDLVRRAERWLIVQGSTVVITEMGSASPETPDAIGWQGGVSRLVECKTSRADFLADRKKHFRRYDYGAMGTYRFVMIAHDGPKIELSELPAGWGLLVVQRQGSVNVIREAQNNKSDRSYEISILTSAVRRCVSQRDVRGVRCKVYQIEGAGEARATLAAEPVTNQGD